MGSVATPLAGLAETGTSTDTPVGRVIVKFKPDAGLIAEKALVAGRPLGRVNALGQRLGMTLEPGRALSDRTQVVRAAGLSSEALARRIAEQSDVEFAVVDQRRRPLLVPNDPLYVSGGGNGPVAGQWYLRAPTAVVKSAINAEAAWALTTGSPSIVVAVVDTGVRFEHPDLLAVSQGGNLLPGYDLVADAMIANDGDGRDPDASDPGDAVTQAELSQRNGPFYQCADGPEDSSWHGTQVSGIIAALTDNGIGMASVGRTVRVLPVRVMGKCGGYDSDIIAGMRWAGGLGVPDVPLNPNPAKVVNLSLGGAGECSFPYRDAVSELTALGVSIVAAAGNGSGHTIEAPANCPGIIAVTGLRHAGTKVGFSDLGPEAAISAPGGNCVNVAASEPCLYPILSTSNAGTLMPAGSIYTDSYNITLGTSFSAPLVSGTVALMLAVEPALSPPQVLAALKATARPFPVAEPDAEGKTPPMCTAPVYDDLGDPIDQFECQCTTSTCGAGMLDAGAAVAAVLPGSGGGGTPVPAQGLWWNSPADSEPGWGINFVQQGDVLFGTWFSFDAAGKPWWLIADLRPVAGFSNAYAGPIATVTGPPFGAAFDSAQVVETVVGTMGVSFASAADATLSFNVNGYAASKAITKQVFGPLPTCVWSASADLAAATNYQDLWWRAPAGSEAGWGINLTHQGDIIFATWFTYDAQGKPWWLVADLRRPAAGANVFTGQVMSVEGSPFNAPYDGSRVRETPVGTATLSFASGDRADFAYVVNGVTGSKPITRQILGPSGGTICR